jgi:hypothetical protein
MRVKKEREEERLGSRTEGVKSEVSLCMQRRAQRKNIVFLVH